MQLRRWGGTERDVAGDVGKTWCMCKHVPSIGAGT